MTTPKARRRRRHILDLDTHDQPHVRISQVSAYLQVDRRTVEKWIDTGQFEAIKLPDGTFRIVLVSLRAFIARARLRSAS